MSSGFINCFISFVLTIGGKMKSIPMIAIFEYVQTNFRPSPLLTMPSGLMIKMCSRGISTA